MNSRLRAAAPPPVGLRRRSSRPGGDAAITLPPTRVTTWLTTWLTTRLPPGYHPKDGRWPAQAGAPTQVDLWSKIQRSWAAKPP